MSAELVPFKSEHLYLVEVVGRGVKVGVSRNPSARIKAHMRDAAAYGCTVVRTWVSPIAHSNARQNERAIMAGSRREYLSRTFDDCMGQAASLTFSPIPEQQDFTKSEMNQLLAGLFPSYGKWLADEAVAK